MRLGLFTALDSARCRQRLPQCFVRGAEEGTAAAVVSAGGGQCGPWGGQNRIAPPPLEGEGGAVSCPEVAVQVIAQCGEASRSSNSMSR